MSIWELRQTIEENIPLWVVGASYLLAIVIFGFYLWRK